MVREAKQSWLIIGDTDDVRKRMSIFQKDFQMMNVVSKLKKKRIKI